jgi:hypothetical protein
MSYLTALKLVTSNKYQTINPIVSKRNKLCEKLFEQIAVVEADMNNESYTVKKLKTFKNKDTNERMQVEVNKRIRKWYWVNESGKINCAVKYGAKTLALTKDGKNAIEVNDKNELVNTLKAIKEAVLNGELDTAISNISDTTKRGFKK